MIKVLVNGANGRMGKEAVNAINNDAALNLVGEIDYKDDLAATIASLKPDVVVDFTAASSGFENTKINSKRRRSPSNRHEWLC